MQFQYDIYGFSKQRDKKTIEHFLDYFSFREKIENRENQEIGINENEKYNIDEFWIPIKTLSEVINYGVNNLNFGFSFYIADNLKKDIKQIIIKFTYDKNIIFGISIDENRKENNKLIDNYDKAIEIEKTIEKLTNSIKTSIQFENAPSNDEEGFENEVKLWENKYKEKNKKYR